MDSRVARDGHGANHAFKRLEAINFGLNHPLELLVLVLPAFFVEVLFGVGTAAAGAALITIVQTSLAHANVRMNSRVVG